ncbi:MAG: YcxB family protein [Bacteroidetes bacterium]|nr:YcxB family protein [Bacteroidota bacterium]
MQPFSVSSHISLADFTRFIFRNALRNPVFVIAGAVGLVLDLLWLLSASHVIGLQIENYVPGIFFFFPLIIPLLLLYLSIAGYSRSKRLKGEIEYTFSEAGIAARSHYDEWSYDWNMISRTAKSGRFLLLYIRKVSMDAVDTTNLTSGQLDFIYSHIRSNPSPRVVPVMAPGPAVNRDNDDFSVSFQAGYVEYVRISLQIYRYSRRWIRMLLIPAIVFLFITGQIIYLDHKFPGATESPVWGFIIPLIIIFPIVMMVGLLIPITAHYLQAQHFLTGVTYHFNHWGMERSGAGTGFSTQWRNIVKVRETKSYFLFFVTPNVAHSIQKQRLGDEDNIDAFRTFVNDRMQR